MAWPVKHCTLHDPKTSQLLWTVECSNVHVDIQSVWHSVVSISGGFMPTSLMTAWDNFSSANVLWSKTRVTAQGSSQHVWSIDQPASISPVLVRSEQSTMHFVHPARQDASYPDFHIRIAGSSGYSSKKTYEKLISDIAHAQIARQLGLVDLASCTDAIVPLLPARTQRQELLMVKTRIGILFQGRDWTKRIDKLAISVGLACRKWRWGRHSV